jgi:hypothetical protein
LNDEITKSPVGKFLRGFLYSSIMTDDKIKQYLDNQKTIIDNSSKCFTDYEYLLFFNEGQGVIFNNFPILIRARDTFKNVAIIELCKLIHKKGSQKYNLVDFLEELIKSKVKPEIRSEIESHLLELKSKIEYFENRPTFNKYEKDVGSILEAIRDKFLVHTDPNRGSYDHHIYINDIKELIEICKRIVYGLRKKILNESDFDQLEIGDRNDLMKFIELKGGGEFTLEV